MRWIGWVALAAILGVLAALRIYHRSQRFSGARELRFTRDGKYFVGITLGIGFAAVNTGNNLLYLVLGMMLGLIITSGVLSELTLRDLSLSRVLPPRLYAGRPFLVGLSVTNRKRRVPSFSVSVEEAHAEAGADRRCYFFKVAARATAHATYRHVFARRGKHQLDGIKLKTRFPFSLFEKGRFVGGDQEVVVYPELVPLPTQELRVRDRGHEDTQRVGRHGEFYSLREYRQGDDPRDIFWRKSAGLDRLVLREREDPWGGRVTVLLDNRRRAAGDGAAGRDGDAEYQAQERAVSRAASLVVHYLERAYAVRLVSYSGDSGFGTGTSQIDRLLRELALLDFVDAATVDARSLPAGEGTIRVAVGAAS